MPVRIDWPFGSEPPKSIVITLTPSIATPWRSISVTSAWASAVSPVGETGSVSQMRRRCPAGESPAAPSSRSPGAGSRAVFASAAPSMSRSMIFDE